MISFLGFMSIQSEIFIGDARGVSSGMTPVRSLFQRKDGDDFHELVWRFDALGFDVDLNNSEREIEYKIQVRDGLSFVTEERRSMMPIYISPGEFGRTVGYVFRGESLEVVLKDSNSISGRGFLIGGPVNRREEVYAKITFNGQQTLEGVSVIQNVKDALRDFYRESE